MGETFTPLHSEGGSGSQEEVHAFGKDDGDDETPLPITTPPPRPPAQAGPTGVCLSLLAGPPKLSGFPSLLLPMLLLSPGPSPCAQPSCTTPGPECLPLHCFPVSFLSARLSCGPVSFIHLISILSNTDY